MKRECWETLHFRNLTLGEAPNVDRHDGKRIGVYSSEVRALDGMRRVAAQPGFRDWPDGFRAFTDTLGRVFWSQGFEPGPDGADVAISGDPSGRDGSDAGLAEWGQNTSRDITEYEAWLAGADDPDLLWELFHYKISDRNDQNYEDMGMKFLGFFASRAEAEAAQRTIADKPGFRNWPGGFRLSVVRPDTDQWLEGFASFDDE